MPCWSRLGLASSLLAATACGPDRARPDAGTPDAPAGPVDLANATWELEPVHQSSVDSTDPQLAFDSEGRAVVVWEEGIEGIGFAFRDQGRWITEVVDPPDAGEAFSPFIAAGADGEVHIVFSGDTAATGPDIFYMRWDGVFLSTPTNLTGPAQSAPDFDASASAVALEGGAVMVLFYTSPEDVFGERQMNKLVFTDPAAPGAAEVVLPAARNCGEIKPVRGDDGTVHIIAKCIPAGTFEVVYLNDRGGPFADQLVAPGEAANMLSPDLGLSPGEDAIHVAFRGTVDCGPETCTDIFYSTNLSRARPVTGTPEEGWENPTLIVDGEGRVVLAFHAGESARLHWSFIDDSGGFFRPQRVDPSGGGVTQSEAGFGAADPGTGLPWIAFERAAAGAPPDIWVGQLVP